MQLLPYTPERDVYRLLGVQPSATIDEIGMACRRLALAFHPDHNGSPRATQEMQVVNAVRQVMTDPSRRASYDRERIRFHSRRISRTPAPLPIVPPLVPLRLEQRPSPIVRYGRALAAALRATAMALVPDRCPLCRFVVDNRYSYCAACGTPLGGG